MGTLIVSGCAVVLAFSGLLATIIGLRRKTDESYTSELEKKVAHNASELEDCKKLGAELRTRLDELTRTNFALLMENRELLKKFGP